MGGPSINLENQRPQETEKRRAGEDIAPGAVACLYTTFRALGVFEMRDAAGRGGLEKSAM